MASTFPNLDELRGIGNKLSASGCEVCASLIADENRSAQLRFEGLDSSANSRLRDMQPF
jgi:hypothetical protein